MRKKIIQYIFTLGVSSFFLALPLNAQSQKTDQSILSVSPTIFNIVLSPGKIYKHELRIKNNTSSPLPLTLSVEPILVPDEDNLTPSPSSSIVSWTKFESTQLLIPAGQTQSVGFSIKVPEKVPLGGYYGMLYLNPLFAKQTKGSDVSTRIGILLLSGVGVQEIPLNKVAISRARTESFLNESKNPILDFAVKNMALNHFSAKPFLTIQPLIGKTQHMNIEEKFVFPGKSRAWKVPVSLYKWNIYNATLSVSVGGGNQKIARFSFIVFPLKKAMLLLVIIITIGMIMKKRDRLLKAMRIILKG